MEKLGKSLHFSLFSFLFSIEKKTNPPNSYYEVNTGSITKFGDAYVAYLNASTGDLLAMTRWGSKRRDVCFDLNVKESVVYSAALLDEAISHVSEDGAPRSQASIYKIVVSNSSSGILPVQCWQLDNPTTKPTKQKSHRSSAFPWYGILAICITILLVVFVPALIYCWRQEKQHNDGYEIVDVS